MSEVCVANTTSDGCRAPESGFRKVARSPASLRDKIKWLQDITFTHITRLLEWSGNGAIAGHRYILGIRYGVIKLCPPCKDRLDTIEMETTYLAIGICDQLQTEGEDEEKIIDRTIHNQSPSKWRISDMNPSLAYFENDHSQEDSLAKAYTSET